MEVEESVEDMAKKIVDLEGQWKRWEVEKAKLKEQVMELKGEEARMKEKYKKAKQKYMAIREEFDSEKKKWREENGKITEKYWDLEVMKSELAIDLEAALSQLRGGGDGASEAEVERLKSSLEERNDEITNLLGKIEALDRKNNSLERDLRDKLAVETKKTKMEEEKNSSLIQKIQALERDKEQMVAEVLKFQKEKREEAEKSVISAKKAVEAEKKSKEVEGKNLELAKKIVEYERSKKDMQNEVSRLNREKGEEFKKMLNEKMAYEETVGKLMKKNEALEKEKKEMEAKLSRANMEKDAEIKRILKEEMALKEEERKITSEREEYIKILYRENQTLEAQNKQLQMEKIRLGIKREECMELAHQTHLGSNVVGISGIPAAQILGNIKIEAQTTLSSAGRSQPLPGNLTQGSRVGVLSNSIALDYSSTTEKNTRS